MGVPPSSCSAMAEAAARPQFDARHNEAAKRFEIELAGPDGKPQVVLVDESEDDGRKKGRFGWRRGGEDGDSDDEGGDGDCLGVGQRLGSVHGIV